MEKNIQILIDHFGGQKKTAQRLNITYRYLCELKSGRVQPGKFLNEKIQRLIEKLPIKIGNNL